MAAEAAEVGIVTFGAVDEVGSRSSSCLLVGAPPRVHHQGAVRLCGALGDACCSVAVPRSGWQQGLHRWSHWCGPVRVLMMVLEFVGAKCEFGIKFHLYMLELLRHGKEV